MLSIIKDKEAKKLIKKIKDMSSPTKFHYFNIVVRGCIFIAAIIVYISKRKEMEVFSFIDGENFSWYFVLPVWLFFMVEAVLRLFPTKLDPRGCKKHFKSQFMPTKETAPKHDSWKGVAILGAVWIVANSIPAILYFCDVIDQGILVIIALFYSVGDMICVLVTCPLRDWFMKNRCCADCRIYNWDFLMMFTPLIFIPHFYTWSLVAVALVIFIKWEVSAFRHKERFCCNTNSAITCKNCTEKVCPHQKRLKKLNAKKQANDKKVNV